MRMHRERVVAPAVVMTEAAVCFDATAGWFVVREVVRVATSRWRCPGYPATGWFVVREVVRVATATGEILTEVVSSPLSRRQLEAEFGGPELANFLMAHPGTWWRVPMSRQGKEGGGV